MATPADTSGADDFIKNLGKIYGLYAGGFLAFVIFLAILEQVGVPNRILGYLFVFFTIAVYAIIGVLSRTAQVSEYYVAGRRVPAFYNGMATGADWMSAASFVGMAGTLFLLGYDGLAWVLGWTGGYVLVSVLVGPYLRKFGAYTVPDFMSFRFGGNFARFLAVIVLVACSFTYVTAQIFGTGLIASRFLGMQFEVAVFVGLVGILLCSMLGGMRAVTWTQIAQYIVLIVAYLTPIIILSTKKYGIPIPQLTYGQAIADITAREGQMLKDGLATVANLKPHIQPWLNYTPLNFFAIIFCMMVGTASLPHILMRYFTTPSVREARQSVAWSLFFIFLLYFSAPAYAAFSKLEVYTNIIGRDVSQIRPWMFTWGELGLIQVCGKNAASLQAVIDACKAAGTERRPPAGLRDQHRRDRAVDTGNCGSAVRDLGSGRRRRSCRRALDRGRPAARHRQRAVARRLLQDDRSERADGEAADGRPHPAAGRGGRCGGNRLDKTGGHPGHGRLGILARHGRQLPGADHGHLVETGHDCGRHCRHHRWLRYRHLLPRLHPLLPGLWRGVFRHVVPDQPGRRSAGGGYGQGHGGSECHGYLGHR